MADATGELGTVLTKSSLIEDLRGLTVDSLGGIARWAFGRGLLSSPY